VIRTVAAVVVAAFAAFVAAPAAERTQTLPLRVSVAGVRVGGLTAEPARARVESALAHPVSIVSRGRAVARIDPDTIGASADVAGAIAAAFTATPGSRIAVPLRVSARRLDHAVAAVARRFDRAAVPARLLGAPNGVPQFRAARPGIAVRRRAAAASILAALPDGTRPPLQLPTRRVAPVKTVARFGPVIVVDRGHNELRLYDGRRLVRRFPVATGQAIYPTPAGTWHIVVKQRDPWWYPPTYDSWAKGLKPVPPGPGNPLGTRWMGLDAPGVGIHGTDEPSSIGYSASHGCIRMQVPDAEWLFDHVTIGVPVVVV